MRNTFQLSWKWALLVLPFFVLSACTQQEPPPEPKEVRVYEGGKGRIKDIVADGNMAIVIHDEIPGFMMGMTMPFGIREDSIREAIAVGDSIAFDVSSDGIDNWISRVTVIK
jgi:Cu/Ag efflux protein CusF